MNIEDEKNLEKLEQGFLGKAVEVLWPFGIGFALISAVLCAIDGQWYLSTLHIVISAMMWYVWPEYKKTGDKHDNK